MLSISFETRCDPQTVAHIQSDDGILGHLTELQEKIPAGTWITIAPEHQPTLTLWLCQHGFTYEGIRRHGEQFYDVIRRS